MLKYLNLPLSSDKALRIFSEVEKGDGTVGTVGTEDFEVALQLLAERVAPRARKRRG